MKGLEKNSNKFYIEELDERLEFFFFGFHGGHHDKGDWGHDGGNFFDSLTKSFDKFCHDNGITKDNLWNHWSDISDWCSKNCRFLWDNCKHSVNYIYYFCHTHFTSGSNGCNI